VTTVRLSAVFVSDVEEILDWSGETFGPLARERYRILLATAVHALEADPHILTANAVPELGNGYWVLHLASMAQRVKPPADRVKNPRHYIVYRHDTTADVVHVARAMHDTADLKHFILSGNYWSSSSPE